MRKTHKNLKYSTEYIGRKYKIKPAMITDIEPLLQNWNKIKPYDVDVSISAVNSSGISNVPHTIS